MPLMLDKNKAAQKTLLTCLAVKSALAHGQDEEEERQCLLWLSRGMQIFSLTTKVLDPYVDALSAHVFLNECSEDDRRYLLEHHCRQKKFNELFAQLEYLYAQENCPEEVLEFLRQNYQSFQANKLSKREAAKLDSLDNKHLPEKWFNQVRYDFE